MVKQKSKPRQRDIVIDFLRTISIIVMIFMHISPYFPRLPFAVTLWRWGQWVVPAFILCSLAVDTAKVRTVSGYLSYLKIRFIRLLPPYYLWLLLYVLLMSVIGHKQVKAPYIIQNFFMIGGSDFNWLVLLFLYVTIALPVLRTIVRRSEAHSLLAFFLSILPSALFLSNRTYWSAQYRLWMFFPWIGITIGILLFLKWWSERDWPRIGIFATTNVGIFLYWYTFFQKYQITTNTFHHKYPPDIYFVSFSLWSVILVYILVYIAANYLKNLRLLTQIVTYISANSYTIFFVHILVLYVLDVSFPTRPFDYPLFTLLVCIPTVLITWLLEYVGEAMRYLRNKAFSVFS